MFGYFTGADTATRGHHPGALYSESIHEIAGTAQRGFCPTASTDPSVFPSTRSTPRQPIPFRGPRSSGRPAHPTGHLHIGDRSVFLSHSLPLILPFFQARGQHLGNRYRFAALGPADDQLIPRVIFIS